ncbi:MAG: hypothetical protein NT040_11540 [Bacteroidetes bacterium]|nr:hypothetical protein [Bacteroidota bacterium]
MRISRLFYFCFLVGLISVGFLSCRKKDQVDTSPGLQVAFSSDTVFFDTVFPTVGSITKRLVVYNRNKNKVSISSIILAGGEASSYRININGTPATSATGVEVAGGDSIYIFVRVTIDPHNANTPFVVSDSLQFITNGNSRQVKLVAWGREAIFYRKATLKGNITWDSLRAHVIYGSLRMDTNSTLTILPGTKVYFHKDAYMAISYQSTLKIEGTTDHMVRFRGDRMDPFYKDLPGQWGGIYLESGSKDHEITCAFIQNGMFGLSVDSLGSPSLPMLRISNSVIENMASVGIYAYGSSIAAVNCVIGGCGGNCLSVNYGGSYDFRYLTVGNYWYASVRHAASIYLSNYSYDSTGNKVANPLSNASFTNAIIYGSNDEEIQLDSVAAAQFVCTFDHALLKTKLKTTYASRYISCLINKDPEFVDVSGRDYRIDSISPAIQQGIPVPGVATDILGNERGGTPALGAYEYVKKN